MKLLLTHYSQWTQYIENVIKLITVNSIDINEDDTNSSNAMDQTSFPFCICDISLPQDQTGYTYFLMSRKNKNFVYIGSTLCLRSLLIKHNSGTGSFEVPIQYRSYLLMVYICGFRKEK